MAEGIKLHNAGKRTITGHVVVREPVYKDGHRVDPGEVKNWAFHPNETKIFDVETAKKIKSQWGHEVRDLETVLNQFDALPVDESAKEEKPTLKLK